MKVHLRSLIMAVIVAQLNFTIVYLFKLKTSWVNVAITLLLFVVTYIVAYFKFKNDPY